MVPTNLSMARWRAFSFTNIRKVCPVMAAPTTNPMAVVTRNSRGTPWQRCGTNFLYRTLVQAVPGEAVRRCVEDLLRLFSVIPVDGASLPHKRERTFTLDREKVNRGSIQKAKQPSRGEPFVL